MNRICKSCGKYTNTLRCSTKKCKKPLCYHCIYFVTTQIFEGKFIVLPSCMKHEPYAKKFLQESIIAFNSSKFNNNLQSFTDFLSKYFNLPIENTLRRFIGLSTPIQENH